jgi:uncharacterized protein (DUF433 family)
MIALRKLVARLRNRKFTATEVAAMFNLSVSQVNNLIDELTTLNIVEKGNGKRLIEYRGLFAILLMKDLTQWQLEPTLRINALEKAISKQSKRVDIPNTSLSVLVNGYRESAKNGLAALYSAEEAVQISDDVMQGEPCISGTRIPVYVVSAMAEKLDYGEVLKTYPILKSEQIEHAVIYAKAHPRKGRPKSNLPKPKASTRIPLAKNNMKRGKKTGIPN